MTICTGVNILASSGALAGHNATAPYSPVPPAGKEAPAGQMELDALGARRKRQALDQRIDRRNGQDTWSPQASCEGLLLGTRPELVEFVLTSAAVGDRGKEYTQAEKRMFESLDFSRHLKMHEEGDLGSGSGQQGGMAGMDHSAMGHGGMAGMDHGGMAGMRH